MDRIETQHDNNSTAEIVAFLLSCQGQQEDDSVRDAFVALHWRGSKDVFDIGSRLCQSNNPYERWVGCNILSQLGIPERSFPVECVTRLVQVLQKEEDCMVIKSALIALSHHEDNRAVAIAKRFLEYPNAEVRYAVAWAFFGYECDEAILGLIQLSKDTSVRVRSYAAFGLGSQVELDSPPISLALTTCLDDTDPDVRGEALVGLARRHDRKATKIVKESWPQFVGTHHFEEAKTILVEEGVIRRAHPNE